MSESSSNGRDAGALADSAEALSIDGRPVGVREGDTIFTAARRAGIGIAAMCADPRIKPTGQCDICVVEVAGRSRFVKACTEPAQELRAKRRRESR